MGHHQVDSYSHEALERKERNRQKNLFKENG